MCETGHGCVMLEGSMLTQFPSGQPAESLGNFDAATRAVLNRRDQRGGERKRLGLVLSHPVPSRPVPQ